MKLSPYFHDLRSAYQAELDDLASDSEGNDVLRRRLAEKRGEIAFLAKMTELAPEMVAPVFHGAFRFTQPAAVQHLLALPQDAVPDWQTLAHAVTLEPWAQSLAQTVLREPQGARFMTVAAALEYLHQHARLAPDAHADDAPYADEAEHDDGRDDDDSALSADDAVDPQSSQDREEAGAEWLADVGFDRKD
ncbi:MAG: hypothetical protein QM569_11115 [Acidovorax sp.]|uniref:hypothetical protein n=1 Tax=Acidovorax sp. TaxID=1872122 RepID=UPI0039E644D0